MYSLTGRDAAAFAINARTGVVTLTANPNFEATSSYAFTVVATDSGGNSDQQAVTLAITNVDEVAPTITSGAAAEIDENSGDNQVVYQVTSTDPDVVSGSTTYSLGSGGDRSDFTISSQSGVVRLIENPDFEAQPSYTFTAVATDAAGNRTERQVTLTVNDLDEVAPTITSGTTAAITENSGAGQVVYTVTSTDNGGATTYSLTSAGDGNEFSINASTGQVTLIENPDFESQPSYAFTVRATDPSGNSSTRAVTLTVTDVDDDAPDITSSSTAPAIDENSGENLVIYTATANETVTWSLTDSDSALTINASSGAVTLTENPDFETQSSYAFTVVATDAGGNSSERDVTLSINDVDEQPPTITSSSTAPAIQENSGEGQAVYTATADEAVTWALADSGDGDDFDINAGSGVVTLIANPDFEEQSSYDFTVVATDSAGNSSERDVTLEIGDVDEGEDDDDDVPGVEVFATLAIVGDGDSDALVFDLATGSDHGGRTFQNDESYDISIRVDGDSASLPGDGASGGYAWSGASNLGSDDHVTLVGNDGPVPSLDDWPVSGMDAGIHDSDVPELVSFEASLLSALPNAQGGQTGTMFFTNVPVGILTSQGLV
jgi:hypothetical protein